MSGPAFFIGIDLGNSKHAICVIDGNRKLVRKITMVDNDLSLVEFIDKAIGDVAPERVHVGVEDRNNVVSDELLRRGFRVFTANPKHVATTGAPS